LETCKRRKKKGVEEEEEEEEEDEEKRKRKRKRRRKRKKKWGRGKQMSMLKDHHHHHHHRHRHRHRRHHLRKNQPRRKPWYLLQSLNYQRLLLRRQCLWQARTLWESDNYHHALQTLAFAMLSQILPSKFFKEVEACFRVLVLVVVDWWRAPARAWEHLRLPSAKEGRGRLNWLCLRSEPLLRRQRLR